MDFSLMFSEQFAVAAPAEQRRQILATNQAAFRQYGITLTQDEAEMIAQTGREAVSAAGLVAVGGSIVPRLIHWFLPSGYLSGQNYAQNVANLTEAFYRLRGALQELTAGDPSLMLSDNALLYYMYQFYVSPTCSGDIDEMLAQAERILLPAMRRLLERQAAEKKQSGQQSAGDPVTAALYADLIEQERAESEMEQASEEEAYDYDYRTGMVRDCFGNYEADYSRPDDVSRGTFAEELAAALRARPEFLIPSAAMEAEWEDRAEQWEEADAKAGGEEDAP